MTAFRGHAVSAEVEQRAVEVLATVTDALSLAVLCCREPVPGPVTELENGTLVRSDLDAPDLSDHLGPSLDEDDADLTRERVNISAVGPKSLENPR